MDFAVPTDHRVNLKENEKKDKYIDLARELKKLEHESDVYTNCDYKRLLKGQVELEIRGRVETSKLQQWWKQSEYWEESWRLEATCCQSNSGERPSTLADRKNSKRVNNKILKIIIIIIIIKIIIIIVQPSTCPGKWHA